MRLVEMPAAQNPFGAANGDARVRARGIIDPWTGVPEPEGELLIPAAWTPGEVDAAERLSTPWPATWMTVSELLAPEGWGPGVVARRRAALGEWPVDAAELLSVPGWSGERAPLGMLEPMGSELITPEGW